MASFCHCALESSGVLLHSGFRDDEAHVLLLTQGLYLGPSNLHYGRERRVRIKYHRHRGAFQTEPNRLPVRRMVLRPEVLSHLDNLEAFLGGMDFPMCSSHPKAYKKHQSMRTGGKFEICSSTSIFHGKLRESDDQGNGLVLGWQVDDGRQPGLLRGSLELFGLQGTRSPGHVWMGVGWAADVELGRCSQVSQTWTRQMETPDRNTVDYSVDKRYIHILASKRYILHILPRPSHVGKMLGEMYQPCSAAA